MPQDAWSPKRERQYEHIKGSLKERGTGEEKGGRDRGEDGEQGARPLR